jgi:hypothetical protein
VAKQKIDRTCWAQVFSLNTWQEFLAAGGDITGFRDTRWGRVRQLKPGDYLMCYLSGVGSWIAILEVESEPFLDTSRIWNNEVYPCRTKVRIVASLSPQTAVPIRQLRERLTIFRKKNWGLYLMSSPTKWNAADAEVVCDAVLKASYGSRLQK